MIIGDNIEYNEYKGLYHNRSLLICVVSYEGVITGWGGGGDRY